MPGEGIKKKNKIIQNPESYKSHSTPAKGKL